jgi:hypothetical protein
MRLAVDAAGNLGVAAELEPRPPRAAERPAAAAASKLLGKGSGRNAAASGAGSGSGCGSSSGTGGAGGAGGGAGAGPTAVRTGPRAEPARGRLGLVTAVSLVLTIGLGRAGNCIRCAKPSTALRDLPSASAISLAVAPSATLP